MKKKLSFNAFLENNTFLIILSVIGAVIVWYGVVSAENDATYTVRNVPVFVDLEDSALARLGLEPVADASFFADVEITGSLTTVGNIKASDVQVVAKLTNVNGPGTFMLALEGHDQKTKDFEIKNITPDTVSMRFDQMITRTFSVRLDLNDLTISDGYVMDQAFVNPSEITVTGPATEMAGVDSGGVYLEFSDPLAQTTTYNPAIVLHDINGEQVESPYFEYSQQTVAVPLPVLKKKNIPVTFDFINVPQGFDTGSLDYLITPPYIEVAGPVASINSYNEMHLGYIDLRTMEPGDDLYYSVSLPQNYIAVENIQEVNVQFGDEGFDSKVLNVTDIRLINQPNSHNVEILTKTIFGITVYGPKNDVAALTGRNLIAQIDMSDLDLRTGTVTVPVTILIPSSGSCWAYGDNYTAVVNIANR